MVLTASLRGASSKLRKSTNDTRHTIRKYLSNRWVLFLQALTKPCSKNLHFNLPSHHVEQKECAVDGRR